MKEDEIYELEEEFGGKLPYFFSPSITKTRIIKGKTYIVRSYFAGNKDFKKIMCDQAFKQALADNRKGEN